MYKIIAIAGFLIRQFIIPNPFSAFGGWGELYNLLASGVIATITYFSVGLLYEKGEAPIIGSILYLAAYSLYTFELWLILLPYPNWWLIGLIFVLASLFDIAILHFIRKYKV